MEKRIKIIIFILTACLLSLISCDRFIDIDFGFPKKVTFSKEGGTQYFVGKIYFLSILVENDGDGGWLYRSSNDGIYGTFDWLTIESPADDETLLILTAAPSDEDSPRKMKLSFTNFGPTSYVSNHDTVVVQE